MAAAPAPIAPIAPSPWVEEPLVGQAEIHASPADESAADVSPIVASSEQAGDTVMLPMPEPEWRPEPEQSPEPEFQSSPEWPLAPDSAPPPALASDAAAEQPAAALPAALHTGHVAAKRQRETWYTVS